MKIIKRITEAFSDLTKFERILWITSVVSTVLSFVLSGGRDYLTLAASLIGVTALIFVAKGYVIGQILTVVFALFYGFISFFLSYYGEMITYLGMSAPMALAAAIEWIRNPYKDTKEVKVRRMTRKIVLLLFASAIAVTALFYFILRTLGNASLAVSTLSVTTSYLASALVFLRSPYYALAYAANDLVLIVLWIVASVKDLSYIPMVACFVMFFANDMYGFFNWRRMQREQNNG